MKFESLSPLHWVVVAPHLPRAFSKSYATDTRATAAGTLAASAGASGLESEAPFDRSAQEGLLF